MAGRLLFFGHPNQYSLADGIFSTVMCIRHEFNMSTANGKSPVAQWLRALSRGADHEYGNRGVGLIGLCLTGSIILSVIIEPSVRVPVMCEPAPPFFNKSALGVPEDDIDKAKQRAVFSPILAYRFSTDEKSPHKRFVTLRETFGFTISAKEICTAVAPFDIPKCAHSVLTGDHPDQDNPNHPVQQAFDETLGRFRSKLDV